MVGDAFAEAVHKIILSELTRGWPGTTAHDGSPMLGPMLMDMVMSINEGGDVDCTYLIPEVWALDDGEVAEFDEIADGSVFDNAVAAAYVLQVSGMDVSPTADSFRGLLVMIYTGDEPRWMLARFSNDQEIELNDDGEFVLEESDFDDISLMPIDPDDAPSHPVAAAVCRRVDALQSREEQK